MKKSAIFFLALISACFLWGCGASGEAGTQVISDEGEASAAAGLPEMESVSSDGEEGAVSEDAGENEIQEESDGNGHTHRPSEGDNIVAHEPAGYCGNTVTTIRCCLEGSEGDWEKSFWGDDSVALTDLLTYLDYREDICRCMPEYTVDTEFGKEYDINLTESYARCGSIQVSLTKEQVEEIRGIIERVSAQPDSLEAGMGE